MKSRMLNPSLVAAILPAGVASIEHATAEQLCNEANKYLHHTSVVAGEPLRKSHLFRRLVDEAVERMNKEAEDDKPKEGNDATSTSTTAGGVAPYMEGWRAHLPMKDASTSGSSSSSSSQLPALSYEDAVEFMCMLVAIDFRHWDEEEGSRAENDGDLVKKIDFWTAKKKGDQESGVMRGSMAMVHLLKSAPLDCRWYDQDYLTSVEHCSGGTEEGITKALTPIIFTGCSKEDVNVPMLMPAIAERVKVLHELAHTFRKRKESNSPPAGDSFVSILNECGGYLYTSSIPTAEQQQQSASDKNGAGVATAGSVGFLDGLFQLSSRFDDSSVVKKKSAAEKGDEEKLVYFFKLAQLTVIALESAFPIGHGVNEIDGLVFGDQCREKFTKETCWWYNGIQFKDRHLLKVCSDYQLPRALWASGILSYDEHLTKLVKEHRLIGVNSVEEIDIRLGSTVASLALMEEANKYLNEENPQTTAWLESSAPGSKERKKKEEVLLVDTGRLDFVLWEEGRNKTSHDLPHHLTRTNMY